MILVTPLRAGFSGKDNKNPRRQAGIFGGRHKIRTCDLYNVNVTL